MANIEDYKDEVGPGWSIILDYIDNALEQWIPGYQIAQVKEKFGELRFYFDFPEDFDDDYDEDSIEEQNAYKTRLWNFVEAMSQLATTVCEECGKPGQRHTNKHRWTKTVCADHKEKD